MFVEVVFFAMEVKDSGFDLELMVDKANEGINRVSEHEYYFCVWEMFFDLLHDKGMVDVAWAEVA